MDSEIVIAVLVVVLGGVAYVSYRIIAFNWRRTELEVWAAANEFSFCDGRDYSVEEQFPPFGCLRRGSQRYAYNIMRSRRGEHDFVAFDYHYQIHRRTGKGGTWIQHYHFTAIIVVPPWALKPLLIRPEGVMDKVAGFFGLEDIDFELDAFSQSFFVQARDRQWAFDVVHQDTMEFLLSQPRFWIEMEDVGLIVWSDRTMKPPSLTAALGVAEGILRRLPPYLVHELKGASRVIR